MILDVPMCFSQQVIYNILLRIERKIDILVQGGMPTPNLSNELLGDLPLKTINEFHSCKGSYERRQYPCEIGKQNGPLAY